MESNSLSSKEYSKIRELVASSNQKSLQSLLGFPSKKSNAGDNANPKIYPSTQKASTLLQILDEKLSGESFDENVDSGKNCDLDVDDILQALLMVDPVFITPWNALVDFASAPSKDSISTISLLQCVSSIEDFLLKAKIPFAISKSHLDEKLFPTPIRELMVEFVEKLRDFLFLSGKHQFLDKTKDPIVTQVSLQLLQTVLITCKGRCSGTFDDIAEAAFFQRPSPQRTKLWIQLVQDSIQLLSHKQIKEIGAILLDMICDNSISFSSSQEAAFIPSRALEIAHTLGSAPISELDSPETMAKFWRKISFVALYQTLRRYDQEAYLYSETCLKEGIVKWKADALGVWISDVIDASSESTSADNKYSIPDWFGVNLLSICVEIFSGDQIPTNLCRLDKVGSTDIRDQKEKANTFKYDEYKSILKFLEGREDITGPQFNNVLNFVLLYKEGQDNDRIFYGGDGIFYLEDDGSEPFDCLSRWGTKILESLRLEDSHESRGFLKKKQTLALSRGIRLVNMVDELLTNCPDECMSIARTFAIVIKTVVYFEIPGCQTFLETKIERDLSKPSVFQNIHFSSLRMIAYSAFKKDSENEVSWRWYGIIERNVPSSHLQYVKLLRSILPDARSGILHISKKLIKPLYSSWGAREYDNETTVELPEPKMQQGVIGGLQGLLELTRADQWDEIENDAWMTLSDLIVDDPPLPQDIRQWLFGTLISFVGNGNFHYRAADRILRATTTRISSFFLDYEDDSKILASPKQIEEIGLLHRLMALLLQYFATGGFTDDYHLHLAQGREVFLRAILLYKKGQLVGNQFHHVISKQYLSVGNGGSDCFFACWFVFLKINLYLLDQIMPKGSKIKTFGHLENSSMNYKISVENLVSNIIKRERSDLIIDGSIDKDDGWILPIWQQSKTTGDLAPVFPCLDLLLEFLFLVPLPAPESLDLEDPLSWKIVTASGYLLRQQDSSRKTTDSVLGIETIKKTAERFLSTSSFLFRSAIDTDCGISALDDLLTPIVSYCSALRLTLETSQYQDCGRLFGNLWNLYQAVASEKACMKIIKYLESHVAESHSVSIQRDRHDFFSLASISTESEIDETVRQLRFFCIEPFLCCLSILTSLTEEEIRNDTDLTRSLTGGILGALATDLRAGLNGKSGGIPRKLYVQYCMCIEECGSLLYQLRDIDFDSSVFHLFREVTKTLSDILVTIPLRDAVLFRTTFLLAVAIFPSMSRDLVRTCLCEADDSKPPNTAGNVLVADSVLFDEVLDDCIDILKRWATLRDPCAIPWLDIAGMDHSEDNNDTAPNNFYSDEETDRAIPRVVHVPSPPRSRRKSDSRHRKTPRKIRLCTKELWSWTLSCSLLGLEQNWLESERTIQEEVVLNQASLTEWKTFFVRRTVGWGSFFAARTSKLQKSLIQINCFFRASQGLQQHDLSRSHIMLDMMAMNLPSAPRLRFCCLIECVSRVLLLSIRTFCSFLREEIRSPKWDLSVFESVSCLAAWLSLDEDPEKDFSVGVFRLLAIVSRKSPPGEFLSTSKKEDKAELFERVSMIAGEVHKLYLELKELQKILRQRGVDSFVVKELLGSFSNGSGHSSIASEMLRCSGLKLHALEQAIPTEFKATSLPDFPSSGLEDLDKKRTASKTGKQAKRPKKRKVQNSGRKNRNKVVDIFMNLDQGTDGARRNSTKDAYADLEDFLVEG